MVINRTYRSKSDHETLVTVLVHGVYTLLSNVAHNTDPDRTDATWAHRIAYTQTLGASDTKQLRRISKDRIVDFAESIDDIFIAYESLKESEVNNESSDAIAVGVYYFEEQDKDANYKW